MASQRRSVWEVRFLRIKEVVVNKRRHLKIKLANNVLKNGLDDEELELYQAEFKLLEKIETEIRDTEDKTAGSIFLMRDF